MQLTNGSKRTWLIILLVSLLAGWLSSPLQAKEQEVIAVRVNEEPELLGLRWSQRTVKGQREVLLQWRQADTSAYTVMSRTNSSGNWKFIANVSPAPDGHSMMNIIGTELFEVLRYDLRQSPSQPPLNPEELYDLLMSNPELAQAAAEAYWQVGVAIGQAFVHPVKANSHYEYYIAASSDPQTPLFQSICADPGTVAFHPANLRAAMVVDIPAELGLIGSQRPFDADERYEWDQYQQARRMHGRTFLVWNTPPESTPPADPLNCSSDDSLRVAGYHLYRRDQLTNQQWQLINQVSDGGRPLLARPGLANDDEQGDFESYFFQEDLLGQYPSAPPSQIFGTHDYRVCVVDYFGQEHNCYDTPIMVRELDTPATVQDVEVSVDSGHTALTLSWTFTDPAESSTPVRYFVTRSSDSAAPPDEWTSLTPQGTTQTTLVDNPPQDIAYWYRLQVRDHAGNWSPPSAPVKGALYDRVPPAFELNGACGAHTWPLTVGDLTNLSETPAQVAFYRGFTPNGPWYLIERIEVDPLHPDETIIHDDFAFSWGRQIFYLLELVDAHGNVSGEATFCMNQPGFAPAASWPMFTVTPGDQSITVHYEENWAGDSDGLTVGDQYAITPQVNITTVVPGPSGNVVTGEPVDPNIHWPQTNPTTPGTIEQHTYTIYTGPGKPSGPAVELLVRETNNFLDTNRHMADLGPVYDIHWVVDDSLPKVQLTLQQEDCGGACDSPPLVAIFRRIPAGNWMQVSSVAPVDSAYAGWLVYDKADLSLDQSYEYTVLAFSPTSYEVLGFWQPVLLPALAPAKVLELDKLQPAGELPPGCNPVWHSPGTLPATIQLDNNWTLTADVYAYDADNDGCPTNNLPSGGSLENLYAQGTLSNGQGSSWYWEEFYDFAVFMGPGTGVHTGGRLFVDIPDTLVQASGSLDVTVEALEFLPNNARAQLVLHLPEQARFTDVSNLRDRWSGVRAVFDQVTTGFTFNYLEVEKNNILLLDENLPWFMQPADGRWFLDQSAIFAYDMVTSDRLYYPQPFDAENATADNNAAFLRVPYLGDRVDLTPAGLAGTFETNEDIRYMPSLPAGFALSSKGGRVVVENSTISGGYLDRPDVTVTYMAAGTVTDLMVQSPAVNLHQGVYPDGLIPENALYQFETHGLGVQMALDTAGRILAPVALTGARVHWTSFSGYSSNPHLFLAPAIFPSSITTQTVNAPTPAIIAWEQMANPAVPGSDFDPGLNFIQVEGQGNLLYTCYRGEGARFDNNMDLYLRRGGMSESLELLLDDNQQRVNQYGYTEAVDEFLAVFVDNAIVEHTMQTQLYLPYPSHVTFTLAIESFNGATNCPQSGGFVEPIPAAHHRFWDFTHQPGSGDYGWQYTQTDPVYYEDELADLPAALFSMFSIATVQGIGQNSGSVPLDFPLHSQWLPDGDIGRTLLLGAALGSGDMAVYRAGSLNYALNNVQLSRYHSQAMMPQSRPETLGLDMEYTLHELPAALTESNGEVTPDSLYACATAGSGQNVGCGFLVLHGRGLTDFFGEVQPAGGGQQLISSLPPMPGMPLGVNTYNGGQVTEVLLQPALLPFAWPLPTGYLSAGLQVYYLDDRATNRTLLVALERDFELLPGPDSLKLLQSDLAAIVEGRSGAPDTLGLYAGYSASQAALRAIAQRHPDTRLFNWEQHWTEVAPYLVNWAQLFGYTPDGERTNAGDPVDLAYDTRRDWGGSPFTKVYTAIAFTVHQLESDAYGLGSIESAGLTHNLGLELEKGMGEVELEPVGQDYRLVRLAFNAEPTFRVPDTAVPYLSADWVEVELNRDGELLIEADGVSTLLTGLSLAAADITVLLSSEVGSERFEGGLMMYDLDTGHGIEFPYLNLVVGAGHFHNETLFYIAAGTEATFDGYTLGGSFLAGSVNANSLVLRDMGYGPVLDKFNQNHQGTYDGFYFSLTGEFPVVDFGCLLRASAGFDVRGWYFGPEVYGGAISGSAHGTVACLISAKGKLSLQMESLPHGGSATPFDWSNVAAECTRPDGCMGFAGSFFLAIGVGFDCDPGLWKTWEGRGSSWWGDSWCYTFGGGVGLAAVTTPGGGLHWEYDYDVDFE